MIPTPIRGAAASHDRAGASRRTRRWASPMPTTMCGSAPVPGAENGSPVLDQYDAIVDELVEYREAGGRPCWIANPAGVGGTATNSRRCLEASGVNSSHARVFTAGGTHPASNELWSGTARTDRDLLRRRTDRRACWSAPQDSAAIRAGFIKIALEAKWEQCPHNGVEGSGRGGRPDAGALMEIHTEKGALAERACTYFMNAGIAAAAARVLPHGQAAGCRTAQSTGRHGRDAGVRHVLPAQVRSRRQSVAAAASAWSQAATRIALLWQPTWPRRNSIAPSAVDRDWPACRVRSRSQLAQRGFSARQQQQLLGGNIARRLAGLN